MSCFLTGLAGGAVGFLGLLMLAGILIWIGLPSKNGGGSPTDEGGGPAIPP